MFAELMRLCSSVSANPTNSWWESTTEARTQGVLVAGDAVQCEDEKQDCATHYSQPVVTPYEYEVIGAPPSMHYLMQSRGV
jgi:hypothetical protein